MRKPEAERSRAGNGWHQQEPARIESACAGGGAPSEWRRWWRAQSELWVGPVCPRRLRWTTGSRTGAQARARGPRRGRSPRLPQRRRCRCPLRWPAAVHLCIRVAYGKQVKPSQVMMNRIGLLDSTRLDQCCNVHVPADDERDASRRRLQQLDRVLSVELGVEHLAVDRQHLVPVLQLTRPALRWLW